MDLKAFGTKASIEADLEELRAQIASTCLEAEAITNELEFLRQKENYLTRKLDLVNSESYRELSECDTER